MGCFCYIDGNVPKEFVVFLLGSVGLMQERSEAPQLQMSIQWSTFLCVLVWSEVLGVAQCV